MRSSFWRNRSRLRSAHDCLQDSWIRPAAAQMTIHRGPDLRFRRPGHLRQKLGSLDDHPVVAVTALNRLFFNECLLYGMERGGLSKPVLLCVPCRQAFECRDRFARKRPYRRHARTRFNAVNEDRAGTALCQTTTESRTLQEQFV